MKTAFVFPGQGSQIIGMGKEFFENFKIAREVIEEASSYVDFPLQSLMFEGPHDDLRQTNVAQTALFAVSVAILKNLPELDVSFLAGHSSGEYAALFASNAFSFEEGVKLISYRGELMKQASDVDHGMSSVIGASFEDVTKNLYGTTVVACDNAPGQIVISGKKTDLAETSSKLQGIAKRIIPLPVGGAFHSPFMSVVQEQLYNRLKLCKFSSLRIPVISNVTARPYENNIIELLREQIVKPVRWRETVLYLESLGVKRIIEVGSQSVLTGLNRRIAPDLSYQSIYDLKSFDEFIKIK